MRIEIGRLTVYLMQLRSIDAGGQNFHQMRCAQDGINQRRILSVLIVVFNQIFEVMRQTKIYNAANTIENRVLESGIKKGFIETLKMFTAFESLKNIRRTQLLKKNAPIFARARPLFFDCVRHLAPIEDRVIISKVKEESRPVFRSF